ncbi:hypothetical protein AF942_03057 [Listeria monocytogenes]|nr:hypothetical protein AF942_03057 [Listeria monocytogenes]
MTRTETLNQKYVRVSQDSPSERYLMWLRRMEKRSLTCVTSFKKIYSHQSRCKNSTTDSSNRRMQTYMNSRSAKKNMQINHTEAITAERMRRSSSIQLWPRRLSKSFESSSTNMHTVNYIIKRVRSKTFREDIKRHKPNALRISSLNITDWTPTFPLPVISLHGLKT